MFKDLILIVASGSLTAAFIIGFTLDSDTPKPEEKTVTVTKVVTDPGVPSNIRVFHDDSRGVTCYQGRYEPLLSCIPDTQLRLKL